MVRNEAKIIRRSVDSAREACDSVLVVDTGSTDETVQLARELGRVVTEHVWKDSGIIDP